jgi:Cu+-exporting ATPase
MGAAESTEPTEAAPTAPSTVSRFGVQGMRCDNCAASVKRRLVALPGVAEADVSYALEEARVRYDATRLDERVLIDEITAAGYEAHALASFAPGHSDEDEEVDAEATAVLRRTTLGIVLSLAIMGLGMGPAHLSLPDFPGRLGVIALLATVVQVEVGRPFHVGAWRAARNRTTNMDTLVSLGSNVAYVYSLAVLLIGLDRTLFPVYFESAAMILTLVTVGKALETRGRREASGAVRALLAQAPDRARVERGDHVEEVDPREVALGEIVLVRPGERVPVDGRIASGASHLDESMLSGESQPIAKGPGDPIHAGTVNREGSLRIHTRAVGEDTTLAGIARLVREAQASHAPIQRTVDRVARVFVPTILVLAALTAIVWYAFGAERYLPGIDPLAAALMFAASTLLISCPCAMGLATPLALVAGTGVGARRGLLIKNGAALEAAGSLRTIILDKTGTLTLGRPTVRETTVLPPDTREAAIALAAAVERESEHPIAAAIVAEANRLGIVPGTAEAVTAIAGRAVSGRVGGREVLIGSRAALEEQGIDTRPLAEAAARATAHGASTAWLGVDGKALGLFEIGDAPDPTAPAALARLRALGLGLRMLTGDARDSARAIGDRLGLADEEVVAEVLPAEKADFVVSCREQTGAVAMVGDGLNDGPALASADVGIAIGSGTDVAIEAADVVLMGDDLGGVADAIVLSRRTLRTIRQNLFWAFGYNVAAIPLAAGLFVPWGGEALRLGPGVAALAMALSSLFVVSNSARLRRFDPGP